MGLRGRVTGEAAYKKPWLSMKVRHQPHFCYKRDRTNEPCQEDQPGKSGKQAAQTKFKAGRALT